MNFLRLKWSAVFDDRSDPDLSIKLSDFNHPITRLRQFFCRYVGYLQFYSGKFVLSPSRRITLRMNKMGQLRYGDKPSN